MVNDVQELLRASVAAPPPDRFDVGAVIATGRRRVRRRRRLATGGAAVVATGALAVGTLLQGGPGRPPVADEPPAPRAPTISLADAAPATPGKDYRELASYTNEDLDADNGQYLDGVTEDGRILFRDGPRAEQRYARYALMDPRTGHKDWLPRLPAAARGEAWPVVLGTDRLVLVDQDASAEGRLTAYVFDRSDRRWSTLAWPTLPIGDFSTSAVAGPDDRLYVRLVAARSGPPEGGWPVGPDGVADDSGADGDTYHLWSVSLEDPADVRDERLTVGSLAFTDHLMTWTDSTNGAAGMVHVRDLATGAEHAFDPRSGARCNLLSFGATDDRIVLGQYCGKYAGGVRDDRVQVLTVDGKQVVTLQGSGLDGGLPQRGVADGEVVTVTAYGSKQAGTYVYDLATDRLRRVSDAVSSWSSGGPTGDGRQFFWSTPVNSRKGATQHLGELLR